MGFLMNGFGHLAGRARWVSDRCFGHLVDMGLDGLLFGVLAFYYIESLSMFGHLAGMKLNGFFFQCLAT